MASADGSFCSIEVETEKKKPEKQVLLLIVKLVRIDGQNDQIFQKADARRISQVSELT